MRILYGIQGTGNGHITRSMQVIEVLRSEYGVEVDVLVSGSQNRMSHLLSPKYNFRGFSLSHDKKGRVKYAKTFFSSDLLGFMDDLREVPFKEYDTVISDFEPITAYGARMNGVPCIGISNQNYIKKTTKNPFKRFFLHLFSPTEFDLSLHFFEDGEPSTFGPIIDLNLTRNTSKGDRVLVYLPYVGLENLVGELNGLCLPEGILGFDVFHPDTKEFGGMQGNCRMFAINRTEFVTKLKGCCGVLTNCGFSTVSEAIFLDKKIWCIPIENQFEQQFNFEKLKSKGYFVSKRISHKKFYDWLVHEQPKGNSHPNSVFSVAQEIVKFCGENPNRSEG
jgi:uncharacterized protein (TIGR00661 family)